MRLPTIILMKRKRTLYLWVIRDPLIPVQLGNYIDKALKYLWVIILMKRDPHFLHKKEDQLLSFYWVLYHKFFSQFLVKFIRDYSSLVAMVFYKAGLSSFATNSMR